MRVCSCPQTLADIIMYGGDTEPWEILLFHDTETPYTEAELNNCLCHLEILPLTNRVYSDSEENDRIVLRKCGRLTPRESGAMSVVFEFIGDDTMNMRGAYIYQVTFSLSDVSYRVYQGRLTVIPNVKRGASQ